MVRELVLQSVVEHWPHRSPDIRRADGELGYLYRLHDIVVYARLVELIADGAADDCQHEHGQQYVDCFPHIFWLFRCCCALDVRDSSKSCNGCVD